jgi:sugar phosphate isomerase/epimerase
MPRKNDYSTLTGQCFINAPFERLQKDLLDLFLHHRFQPEIGLEGNCLWEQNTDAFAAIADKFQSENLQCTLHAPFHDLVPGGFDTRIVELSREKLRRAFALIKIFKPQSIVCHLGFEQNKHETNIERWLEVAVATWNDLIIIAETEGTRVMFENTYETQPSVHRQLFAALESKNIGFCLDTGHVMAFTGTGWQPWLVELEPWLGQLHLHDNDGRRDDHIAIGEGIFDFHALFQHLHDKKITPLVTLEPHTEQDLWLSLENIQQMELFSA